MMLSSTNIPPHRTNLGQSQKQKSLSGLPVIKAELDEYLHFMVYIYSLTSEKRDQFDKSIRSKSVSVATGIGVNYFW